MLKNACALALPRAEATILLLLLLLLLLLGIKHVRHQP